MEIFAERVKLLRRKAKKTQKEMAEYLEIGLRAYQYYEGAKHYPDVPGLIKMADLYGVSVDYLLGRTEEK